MVRAVRGIVSDAYIGVVGYCHRVVHPYALGVQLRDGAGEWRGQRRDQLRTTADGPYSRGGAGKEGLGGAAREDPATTDLPGHLVLVGRECPQMISASRDELAGQHVRPDDRQAGAATHRGPGAVSGIADEGNSPRDQISSASWLIESK